MTDKRHGADLHRVSQQNSTTDFVRGVEDGPHGGFLHNMLRSAVGITPVGRAVAQRTDFDKHDLDLNQMIDLVERTDPEDLESSGKALWDARDAIKAAADELDGHIDKVHWVGESGEAFRKWGGTLVINTHYLGDFAGSAGDEITAAAVGLASVRGAMPPRDAHPSRKRPEKFTAAEKTADKDDYAAAVKVEKDRQEAINQMNRLASYYAVSEEVLASLPAQGRTPEFTAMPDVGVPQPSHVERVTPSGQPSGGSTHANHAPTIPVGHHATVPDHAVKHVTSSTPAPTRDIPVKVAHPDIPVKVAHPDIPVGTNIDTVGTLPPPAQTPLPPTQPVTGTNPTGGGQPHAFGNGFGTPFPNSPSGRGPGGAGGFRTPTSAQSQVRTPGSANSGPGRAAGQGLTNQVGRATSAGRSAAGDSAAGSKSSPMGRGVTGGTPRAGGTGTPRANGGPATGAGRSNGVVGGRPTSTGGAASKGGARVPRGTVIGNEGAGGPRSAAGRSGQRGVFGASEPAARPGANTVGARAGAGTSEAVTGRPAARTSAAGAERKGMTRGGAGLVRGPGRNKKPGEDRDQPESRRPDYLVEDEETHLPDKPRRDVPPAIH
ncbi:hypothetical protein HUT11_29150 [Streptomyces seoulensis]|nr:hypothetical protein HUT11_29150 [Streptomyces seoulensis]